MLVIRKDLPSGPSLTVPDSKFFTEDGRSLPTPEQVRHRGKSTNYISDSSRPPPALFPELGLAVKYGSFLTIAEGQCLWFLNRFMRDRVPTPELYGWCVDGNETFIFMELVHGDTLENRWSDLSKDERISIAHQLGKCVEAWRELKQEKEPFFIGQIGGQGVGDIIFSDQGDAHAGPFDSLKSFHDLFAKYSCRRHPEWNPRRDFEELAGLSDDRPVVFTHADLDHSNILISSETTEGDSAPRIVAIIDWHQSGWYPVDWEWLKAQWRCPPAPSGGRDTSWLAEVMAPADDAYHYAWEYITMCFI